VIEEFRELCRPVSEVNYSYKLKFGKDLSVEHLVKMCKISRVGLKVFEKKFVSYANKDYVIQELSSALECSLKGLQDQMIKIDLVHELIFKNFKHMDFKNACEIHNIDMYTLVEYSRRNIPPRSNIIALCISGEPHVCLKRSPFLNAYVMNIVDLLVKFRNQNLLKVPFRQLFSEYQNLHGPDAFFDLRLLSDLYPEGVKITENKEGEMTVEVTDLFVVGDETLKILEDSRGMMTLDNLISILKYESWSNCVYGKSYSKIKKVLEKLEPFMVVRDEPFKKKTAVLLEKDREVWDFMIDEKNLWSNRKYNPDVLADLLVEHANITEHKKKKKSNKHKKNNGY